MTERPAAFPSASASASAAAAPRLLEMRGISKHFPGVQALAQVDLSLARGEVTAVIGENGAGKSTLIKVLGGIYRPDAGTIMIDGAEAHFASVHDSLAAGISIIHQELNLCDNLDIAGNIFLGREPIANRALRTLDRKTMNARAAELLKKVGLDRAPTTPMTELSTGEQQLVEIAKAISVEARIVVMDEPTSSLSVHESELLFAVIANLKAAGVGILYISHRLPEIIRMADRVVALRDGRRVGELARAEINEDAMVRLMIGRDITDFFPRGRGEPGKTLLRAAGLRRPGSPHEANFELRAGEVLGFAGLVGAGRTELMRVIFGIDPRAAGTIEIEGAPAQIRTVRDAIALGIGMAPEDRKLQGLILEMSIEDNIALPGLGRTSRWGILNRALSRSTAMEHIGRLSIKARAPKQEVLDLSGGNQQKVVIAKWLSLRPKILILDEPTRGVDVNAKAEIYQLMSELKALGVGILMVSSDMEEVLGVSDRIAVMHEGKIEAILSRAEATEEAVMNLASGRREAVSA